MVKKWGLIKSEKLHSYRIFSTRRDIGVSPVTGMEYDFYIIEAPTWVNVVTVTTDNQIVLIKQYRHGIQSVTYEIPGGMVDSGENSIDAAKRELLEETGYASENWLLLGEVHPNPAIQNNICYTYLAKDVYKVREPEPDDSEEIKTFLVPSNNITKLISNGEMTHALVITALYWYSLYQNG